MALLFGLITVLPTLLGGIFALRRQDKLHLILGFSAGTVMGVAFFDLLPEAINNALPRYSVSTVTAVLALGFFLYMLLNRVTLLHPHADEDEEGCENHHHQEQGGLGAASLCLHSLLDGIGIGLAFQISADVGLIVALAVLVHDFSDGINTVILSLRGQGGGKAAFRWLLADAVAPFIGVLSTRFFSVPGPTLGLILALFCGFFLYIGACDLLPESHHHHSKRITSLLTLLGAGMIFAVVRLAHI